MISSIALTILVLAALLSTGIAIVRLVLMILQDLKESQLW
jgi:hypothetical protein